MAFNIPDEYTKLSTATSITFQQFDELPIRAWSKSIWNQLLLVNPQFWMTKCQTWCLQLHEAFEARNEVFLFFHHHFHSVKVNMNNPQIDADIGHLKQVIDVLRQSRQVGEKIYSTDEWKSSVKVCEICLHNNAFWACDYRNLGLQGLFWNGVILKVFFGKLILWSFSFGATK